MKKLTLASFVLSGILLFAIGCKKDDNSSTGSTSTTGTTSTTATTSSTAGTTTGVMTATVDGAAWNAKTFQNTLIRIDGEGKRMDLRGTSANGYQIIVSMADEDFVSGKMPVKTYTFDNDDALFTYMHNNSSEHIPIEGTVTITSCDEATKKVSGVFNFTSFSAMSGDTLKVTNGIFTDLKYTVF